MTETETSVEVKICGITDRRGMSAAIRYKADYIGFVFVEGSSRKIDVQVADDLMREFASQLRPEGRKIVAVMSDPTDKELAEVMGEISPDILQLHGKETRERVREIGGIYDNRIMKALPISSKKDVEAASEYVGYADMLLFDAKPDRGQVNGGHGKAFDWKLLEHLDLNIPWFLSGGLNEENLREAVTMTGAKRIDVSSGVEKEKGVKDVVMIRRFMRAAKPDMDLND